MNKQAPAYTFIFIGVLCVICGIGVASVHYSTLGMLKANESLHNNSLLCSAFNIQPDGKSPSAFQSAIDSNISFDTIGEASQRFPMFRKKDISSPDIGFIFSGIGFWDRITGIIVLSQSLDTIRNVRFLDQKETPGLGARIEEPWFTDQFKGLLVDWPAKSDQRVIIGSTTKTLRINNRIDAITGATQTSSALMRFLNSQLDQFRVAYLNSQGKKKAD